MRSIVFVLIYFSIINYAFTQSKYWVSNDPSDIEIVDFTSIDDALNVISPGDTLLVYNSDISYGAPNISQKVHIIGVGYKLDTLSQPDLMIETMISDVSFGEIEFLNGSEGSSIRGVYSSSIRITSTSNIIVKSCYAQKFRCSNSNDIDIITNFIGNGYWQSTINCNSNPIGVRTNMWILDSNNVLINNNIFSDNYFHPNNCWENRRNLYVDDQSSSVIIKHNIFRDDLILYNSLVKNNIFEQWGYQTTPFNITMTNNIVTNNLFCGGGNDIPAGNTIGNSTECISMFVGGNSFDGKYQLSANSVAIGIGENGMDCGPFDGLYPYKLSGIADRPLIYKFSLPEEVQQGNNINVNLKVRIEN